MDKIFLKNMEFFAYHGVLDEERISGQKFQIDVEMVVDFNEAIASDNVFDTVDYSKVYEDVKEIVTNRRYKLIETLAERIVSVIFSKYEGVSQVIVRIRKPEVTFEGNQMAPEIEIMRIRNA